jgi:hypothetical protein
MSQQLGDKYARYKRNVKNRFQPFTSPLTAGWGVQCARLVPSLPPTISPCLENQRLSNRLVGLSLATLC